ncbi:hypothetical protein [Actinorugispora endophytica]|uniref:Beta-lactamase n=1 Tax=Actinorugispora endophytica TaxID=1605990 RepID=A0A4R6V538_9ACTN|nr:hypothetical protein [Actinorugispora endophytica]TDQ55424.1 hypothetical protein EV190_101751 [Actinorugispora endophytica]
MIIPSEGVVDPRFGAVRDVVWTLGFRHDEGEVGTGGIGGGAAWWSPERGYAMACLTRRLADHSRVDAVAAVEEALDDAPEGRVRPGA